MQITRIAPKISMMVMTKDPTVSSRARNLSSEIQQLSVSDWHKHSQNETQNMQNTEILHIC